MELRLASLFFEAQRVYRGQTTTSGAGIVGDNSAKEQGLNKVVRNLKGGKQENVVSTPFSILLSFDSAEKTIVDIDGKPVSEPSFYKSVEVEGEEFPLFFMVFHVLVRRSTADEFVMSPERGRLFG